MAICDHTGADLNTPKWENYSKHQKFIFVKQNHSTPKEPDYVPFIPKPTFFLKMCTNVSSVIFQFLT